MKIVCLLIFLLAFVHPLVYGEIKSGAAIEPSYVAQTNGTVITLTHTGTSTFPSGVWGNTGNVGIGSTSPLQKAYIAGNVQATGEFIEGTGSIASTASLIPYIQLSSTSNQIAATTPTLITYTNTDEQQTFSFTPTSGTVTIPENGVYLIIAVGQVGKASGMA